MLPPAAAVVLDLKTQEILALASKPNFNLQNLTPFISQSTYDEIQRRKLGFRGPIIRDMPLHLHLNWLRHWLVLGIQSLTPTNYFFVRESTVAWNVMFFPVGMEI